MMFEHEEIIINNEGNIRQGKFNIMNRLVDHARRQIMDQIDQEIFDMFKTQNSVFEITYKADEK